MTPPIILADVALGALALIALLDRLGEDEARRLAECVMLGSFGALIVWWLFN